MPSWLVVILESFMLAASLSVDAFAAGFAYGGAGIRVPFTSVQTINGICTGILGLSLLLGAVIKPYLSAALTTALCFVILFLLGMFKLLDGLVKEWIRRRGGLRKEMRFSLFDIKFILRLYAEPTEADVDASREISPAEAATLAIALSLDGLAVGFGAAMGDVNGWAVVIASLITNTAAVMLGGFLGRHVARKVRFNPAWISGLILIGLAALKLL